MSTAIPNSSDVNGAATKLDSTTSPASMREFATGSSCLATRLGIIARIAP